MLKKLFELGHDFDTFMHGDDGQHVDKVLNFFTVILRCYYK